MKKKEKKIKCPVKEKHIAKIMNKINLALEGTGYIAIGCVRKDVWLEVWIDKE